MAKVKMSEAAVIDAARPSESRTGGWRALRPVRNKDKCTRCMLCWQFCPDSAITKELKIDYDFCKGCGICSSVCPVKAIAMEAEKK